MRQNGINNTARKQAGIKRNILGFIRTVRSKVDKWSASHRNQMESKRAEPEKSDRIRGKVFMLDTKATELEQGLEQSQEQHAR